MGMEKPQLNSLKGIGIYIGLYVIVQLSLIYSTNYIGGKLAIITSIIWMILTIPIYYLSKKKLTSLKYPYSIMNSIIAGIAMSSYYTIKNVPIYNPYFGIMYFIIVMLLSYFLLEMTKDSRIVLISGLITLALSVYLWITYNRSIGSYTLFSSVVFICYGISLLFNSKKDLNLLEIINFASLVMFGSVFFVALTLITEGDTIDGFDFEFDIFNRKNRKIKG